MIRAHDLCNTGAMLYQLKLWSHTLGARSIYWVHISHKESYLGQFAAEATETWQAINQFCMQHTCSYKNFSSHGNPLFSSPLQPEFNIVVFFSSENISQGHELDMFVYLQPGSDADQVSPEKPWINHLASLHIKKNKFLWK